MESLAAPLELKRRDSISMAACMALLLLCVLLTRCCCLPVVAPLYRITLEDVRTNENRPPSH